MKNSVFINCLIIIMFLSFQNSNAQKIDTLYRISADAAKGFNYPYFLFIPKNTEKNTILLVVPNNTGKVNDTLLFHEQEAKNLALRYGIGYRLANELKTPLLVPVFPRPKLQWKIYTHALDRDAMMVNEGDMKRFDLQLIAMIENAKRKLDSLGMKTEQKVLFNGFSASGSFANRFTALHPEIVKAVATGGVNGVCILPYTELKGKVLEYPIGISDFEKITGKKFDIAKYKDVPQFIYMGEIDTNDATLFRDGYSEEESNIIYDVLGKQMMPDRFKACETFYRDANLNAEFKIFPGLPHTVDKQIFLDLCNFFKKHL
jgi:hypothetical protein